METNMTALISCYARAYHTKNYKYRIFSDPLAEQILTAEEYENISRSMIDGSNYFASKLNGSDNEKLRYIVDNFLSPAVLARSVYTKEKLKTEIKLGVKQYLIFASGYDTSAYLNNDLLTYEIDKKEMIDDKIKRLEQANIDYSNIHSIKCDFTDKNWIDKVLKTNYDSSKKTFCSLLGISYYLTKDEFKNMLTSISNIISDGSVIVFDYPNEFKGDKERINSSLADASGNPMKSSYSKKDIEDIISSANLLLYENLNSEDINNQYFYNYNTLNPGHNILTPIGVSYCLIVKK